MIKTGRCQRVAGRARGTAPRLRRGAAGPGRRRARRPPRRDRRRSASSWRTAPHATAGDLRAFLPERVASYKVPEQVLFFATGELPTTASETKVRDDELIAIVTAAPRSRPRHTSKDR